MEGAHAATAPPPGPADVHEAIAAERRLDPAAMPDALWARLCEPGAAAAVRAHGGHAGAALAAAAAARFRTERPGAFTFVHDAGAGGDAAEGACLHRRLLAAIRAHCGLREPLPDTGADLEAYLANWLARAAAGPGGALVAVAGCERLDAAALRFAGGHRPPGLRVLLAADHGGALPAQWPAWEVPPEATHDDGPEAIDAALAAVEQAADRGAAGAGPQLLALIGAARDGAELEALAEALGQPRDGVVAALSASPRVLAEIHGRVYPLGAAVADALARRVGAPALAEAHRRWAALRPADAAWHLARAGDAGARDTLLDDPDCFVTLASGARVGDLLDGWPAERVARAALATADAPAEDAVRVRRIEAAAAVLDQLGSHERLDDLLRTAAGLCERLDGPAAATTAAALDRWGAFRLERGDHDAAAPLLERAHAIRRDTLGRDHADTAATAHRLAQLHEARGDMDTAERAYRAALEQAEAVHGADDAAVLPHLVNLAALRRVRAALETAEPLYRRALKLAEDALGTDHPTTAAACDNLGGCLYSGHDFEGAEHAYRRGLDIAERIFGPAHEATAAALHNLATTLDAQQRFRDAEPYYRRALDLRHAALGEDHEDTLSTLHNLAAVLDSTARAEEAEALYRRAIAGWERLVGREHPATATSVNNLADLLRERGALAEAEELYQRNVETWRRLLGDEHPNTLTTIAELGALYADEGHPDTARPLLEHAMEATGRVMGTQTLAHINAVCRLAGLLRDTGERDAARALLQDTLAAAEGTLGMISPRVQKVRRQLEALDGLEGP